MPLMPPFDLWYPDEDSPVAPLEGLFIQTVNSMTKALDDVRSASPIRVVSAEDRDKKFPNPRQGDRVYRMDLDLIETYHNAYSAQNPNGSIAPRWYGVGGPAPELFMNVDGSVVVAANKGIGFNNTVLGPIQYFHGGNEYFDVNATNREVKAKVSGFYEVEFRFAMQGASAAVGSAKAMVLRNHDRLWPSTPLPETNMLTEERGMLANQQQWLAGRATRMWMSAGDFIQLGVRTINTSSDIRFGNIIRGGMPGQFYSVKYIAPRRNS